MGFFQNACKPEGFTGNIMLKTMNIGHAKLSEWAFSQIDFNGKENALDIGCGGGANLIRLLQRCKEGHVSGIDYSEKSVEMSKKSVRSIADVTCDIRQGNVANLPYKSDVFDIVTAFETIYFWPDLHKCFEGVNRILKSGGRFLVCCECSDTSKTVWTDKIDKMVIYDLDTVKSCMEKSGFHVVKANQKSGTEWICVIGQKK